MIISRSVAHPTRTCPTCGREFIDNVVYTIDEYGDINIEEKHIDCPKCERWAGVELLAYHINHNLEVSNA